MGNSLSVRDGLIQASVADDQPLFLRGIVAALDQHPQLEVVAETTTGDALAAILSFQPDVAIIGEAARPIQRTQLLQDLNRRQTRSKILVVTPVGEPDATQSVLASGVSGYLSRNANAAQTCGATIVVAGGGTVISEEVSINLTEALRPTALDGHNPLSEREQEVLTQIAHGSPARASANVSISAKRR